MGDTYEQSTDNHNRLIASGVAFLMGATGVAAAHADSVNAAEHFPSDPVPALVAPQPTPLSFQQFLDRQPARLAVDTQATGAQTGDKANVKFYDGLSRVANGMMDKLNQNCLPKPVILLTQHSSNTLPDKKHEKDAKRAWVTLTPDTPPHQDFHWINKKSRTLCRTKIGGHAVNGAAAFTESGKIYFPNVTKTKKGGEFVDPASLNDLLKGNITSFYLWFQKASVAKK